MANDKPQMKCPHCDYDLFESGVTERAKCATGIREVHFERTGITINYPKFEGGGVKTTQCNHCKRQLGITIEQLNDVFQGHRTEADVAAECGWTERPIFKCAGCGVNMFEGGFTERTTGMETTHKYTFGEQGPQIEDAEDTEDVRKHIECDMCGGRTEIPASVLMEYYRGEITLEDINGE